MKRISPQFYDKFHCIAGACTDTCCAGWEIDVDANSMARYEALSGELGNYIRNEIDTNEDCSSFRLKEHDRCPFLNEQNLCEMILRGGDELLCEICSEHPRFYEWYGNYEDRGVGLCCEVGCELLLNCDTPLQFIVDIDDDELDDIGDSFFALREAMFRIVQNRELSHTQCIQSLLQFADQTQASLYGTANCLSTPNSTNQSEYYHWLLSGMVQLEPLNDEWLQTIAYMMQSLPTLLAQSPTEIQQACLSDVQWRNVLCYILYRHLPKAQWDGLLLARTAFAVHSTAFIGLLNRAHLLKFGEVSSADHINTLKLWSKQVEYCCENTDDFIDFMIS